MEDLLEKIIYFFTSLLGLTLIQFHPILSISPLQDKPDTIIADFNIFLLNIPFDSS